MRRPASRRRRRAGLRSLCPKFPYDLLGPGQCLGYLGVLASRSTKVASGQKRVRVAVCRWNLEGRLGMGQGGSHSKVSLGRSMVMELVTTVSCSAKYSLRRPARRRRRRAGLRSIAMGHRGSRNNFSPEVSSQGDSDHWSLVALDVACEGRHAAEGGVQGLGQYQTRSWVLFERS